MSTNTGGPAFQAGPEVQIMAKDMTLREYFAGQALAGILANQNVNPLEHGDKQIAELSVFFADAMLAALEAKQ